jgi:hypothetical protein
VWPICALHGQPGVARAGLGAQFFAILILIGMAFVGVVMSLIQA